MCEDCDAAVQAHKRRQRSSRGFAPSTVRGPDDVPDPPLDPPEPATIWSDTGQGIRDRVNLLNRLYWETRQ